MNHYKDFLIKLQTLDLKVNQRNKVVDGQRGQINFYDISHQNPYLSASYKNELKELKELAITDLLNLPREQITFQLQRLGDLKKLFSRFWHNLYNSDARRGVEYLLDYVLSLDLNSIFIAPYLSYTDNALADDNLINDLTDTIRARETILKEFEEAVSKVIDLPKETEKIASAAQPKKLTKAYPVFKEEIIQEFFATVKNYFSAVDQQHLLKLLTTKEDVEEPLLFNGPGNQLADAFKQLYRNMTFNGNSDFRSQFNSDWMNMLIIAVDEVLLDRKEDSEKIKNLSTARTSKTEAKNKDRKEIEFFGKFVLCSNNEENFIVIDPTETRYWIRKIPVLMSENIRLLQDMEKEINHFLYYLLQRPLFVPQGLTRMWFSEKQLRTDALLRVIRNNRNKVETEILLLFKEIFEATNAKELFFANKDIMELLKKNVPRLSRQNIAAVLQQEWKMEPVGNSLSYQTYIYNLSNEIVPVHYTGRYYKVTQDWIVQKFDESS